MKLTVALAQIPVTRDIDANEARILEGIAYAERNGADILLTPEGSLSGYTHEFDAAKMEQALGRVERAAAQAGVGLALGRGGRAVLQRAALLPARRDVPGLTHQDAAVRHHHRAHRGGDQPLCDQAAAGVRL